MIKEKVPISHLNPPENLISWLTHTQMLTRKLENITNNVSLKVLCHEISKLNWWDKYVLGLTSSEALHREVIIYAQSQPCWYARTIIPKNTYINQNTLFDLLNSKTLGELIFDSKNEIQRDFLRYYSIDNTDIEYYWLSSDITHSRKILWARLSKFSIKYDCFYLFEVFLPGLEKYI